MMPRVPHAATVLARGLALHLDALRSGSEQERQRSLGGLTLLRDFGVRLGIVAVGRALDHLLVPDFRRIEVRAPLFVVAPPRSGTTLLYNLLARDPGLVGIRLYESLLPSLTLLDLVDRLAAGLDDDARLRRAFLEHEQSLFADLDPIHRIRYGELEEDTTLFDRHMVCPTALRFFPHGERLAPYLTLDDQPPATRRAVMQAYRRAVQRVLHRSPGRSYLAKNIASAGRIGSLLETFPDARMINIVRHPYQVLPSALRLVDRTFGMGLPDGRRPELPPDDPYWQAHAQLVLDSYRRLLHWERTLPPANWLTLRFEDLVADPMGTVRGAYEHFGMPLTGETEARMLDEVAEADRHRSFVGKPARLEDYGLTRADVYEAMPEVFEAYGFEA